MNEFLNTVDGILDNFNDSEAQSEIAEDAEKYKWLGALPYILPFFFFVPIVLDNNSKYCKFHANQQLCWLIVFLAAWIISMIIGKIPVIGWLIKTLITIALIAIMAGLAYGAYKGKAIKIPVFGDVLNVFK